MRPVQGQLESMEISKSKDENFPEKKSPHCPVSFLGADGRPVRGCSFSPTPSAADPLCSRLREEGALAPRDEEIAVLGRYTVNRNNNQGNIAKRGPRSVMASTPDSHAGGPGFKSRCRPTNFRPVWSPNLSPYPA